jgi:UDP-N-acetylglucosamine 3-dehydrogenase
MNDPRICIIGAGRLASLRIYPYIGTAGGRLVGVCDLDPVKAERNAGRFGGKPYADFEEMLRVEKPDGVIVCIGPEAHAKLAKHILRLGFPIYTEKPPAATAEEAWEVVEVARETGLLCTTAFKKRHTVAARRARQWLDQFPAEDRLSLSMDYCSAAYSNADPRHSFLLDFGIHIIDLARFLFGEVTEVFSFAKGLDAYAVSLRFENGAVGSLNLNDGRTWELPTEEIELTVKGGNFMTIHNSSSWRITENKKACEWREPPTFISKGDSGRDTGHLSEIENFFQALAEKRSTRSEIEQGYRTLVLHDAIAESAASGKVVRPVYRTV